MKRRARRSIATPALTFLSTNSILLKFPSRFSRTRLSAFHVSCALRLFVTTSALSDLFPALNFPLSPFERGLPCTFVHSTTATLQLAFFPHQPYTRHFITSLIVLQTLCYPKINNSSHS